MCQQEVGDRPDPRLALEIVNIGAPGETGEGSSCPQRPRSGLTIDARGGNHFDLHDAVATVLRTTICRVNSSEKGSEHAVPGGKKIAGGREAPSPH